MDEGKVSEVVERVARALFVKAWGEPNYWSEEEDEMEKVFRPNARVAIEAMEVPTEAMLTAACEVGPDTNSGCFDYDDARTVYAAMLGSALK